jgi:hypothetical protein
MGTEKRLSSAVKELFHIPKLGTIAGCAVEDGKISRSARARVLRNGIVMYAGKLSSLRRFKDDVREVTAPLECGIGIENYNDVKVGDRIEAFEIEQTPDSLGYADRGGADQARSGVGVDQDRRRVAPSIRAAWQRFNVSIAEVAARTSVAGVHRLCDGRIDRAICARNGEGDPHVEPGPAVVSDDVTVVRLDEVEEVDDDEDGANA